MQSGHPFGMGLTLSLPANESRHAASFALKQERSDAPLESVYRPERAAVQAPGEMRVGSNLRNVSESSRLRSGTAGKGASRLVENEIDVPPGTPPPIIGAYHDRSRRRRSWHLCSTRNGPEDSVVFCADYCSGSAPPS